MWAEVFLLLLNFEDPDDDSFDCESLKEDYESL